ncbi:hypothetical protein [Thiomonas intermedia]|uniref:hypothetical protein n=1 Tax=Thiomonas intermedia TaxID=926 RepID=UPI0009A48244|nr:hypothetical protein [Thiomonas intermedia]
MKTIQIECRPHGRPLDAKNHITVAQMGRRVHVTLHDRRGTETHQRRLLDFPIAQKSLAVELANLLAGGTP